MANLVNSVVVIGGLHHNTLGVIRSLGEEGIIADNIRVIIVGIDISPTNIISKSKYTVTKNLVYLQTDDEILTWLIDNKKEEEKPCVICCSDGASEVVIKNYNKLRTWYYLPSIKSDIEELMSKDVQNKIARSVGFKVPENITIEISQKDYVWDTFPCITKPLRSVEGGKADIYIVQNRGGLDGAISNISAKNIEIQRYIKKKMEYQLIGCSLDAGRIIIIPGYTNIIRQPDNTNTGYLIYSPIKELTYDRDAVEAFIKETGYSGLFSMEFIRDENGDDYFLEINMRNDGNAYCVKSAGVNLPYIWCHYLLYNEIPNVYTEFDEAVYFMPDFVDIKMGIKTVGTIKWIIQFFEAKSHAVYNVKDMRPFLFLLNKYLKLAKKRIFRKHVQKNKEKIEEK